MKKYIGLIIGIVAFVLLIAGAGVLYTQLSEEYGTGQNLIVNKEAEGAKPRSAMTGDYFLLNCTEAPSVIVECGFLSNAKDEELLCDKVWKRKLVSAIAGGVTAFFAETDAPSFSLCEKV